MSKLITYKRGFLPCESPILQLARIFDPTPHLMWIINGQGLHPRIVAEGFELAKAKALSVLEAVKVAREMDRDILISVARTSLRTKVNQKLADVLTEVRAAASCYLSSDI